MHIDTLQAVALVAALTLLVRAWGWKLGGLKGWLTVPLLAWVLWWALPGKGPLPAVLLALWLYVWRDLPRNTWGMALAPDNNRVPETFGFNVALLSPVFLSLALGYQAAPLATAYAWGGLSVACTALAYLHHRLEPYVERTRRDVNFPIEAACGALAGLAIIAAFAG